MRVFLMRVTQDHNHCNMFRFRAALKKYSICGLSIMLNGQKIQPNINLFLYEMWLKKTFWTEKVYSFFSLFLSAIRMTDNRKARHRTIFFSSKQHQTSLPLSQSIQQKLFRFCSSFLVLRSNAVAVGGRWSEQSFRVMKICVWLNWLRHIEYSRAYPANQKNHNGSRCQFFSIIISWEKNCLWETK